MGKYSEQTEENNLFTIIQILQLCLLDGMGPQPPKRGVGLVREEHHNVSNICLYALSI